jgi:drug/metabolite transporter (DMT)-like permease
VVLAASGYVAGARLASHMPAEQVISWGVLMWLPLTLPACAWLWPAQASSLPWQHWAGFAYVGVVSSWLGFFAWYRALALGGALRVGQLQVAQPFLSGLLAVPLLGEALDPLTGVFLLLVVGTVWCGQRARRGSA